MEEFLEHFIHCADTTRIPPSQRVSFFFRYLAKEQRNFFQTLDGYDTKDWEVFEKSIREEYKEVFEAEKPTRAKLMAFIWATAETPIKTAQQLREYHRNFLGITHALVRDQIIRKGARDFYFWHGLHEQTKRRLLSALDGNQCPNHPKHHTEIYTISSVVSVGSKNFAADV